MPPPPKLLFGPMLIGAFLNTILYGVLVVQTFIYYQTYKKDATWLRYFVLYLFVLETLNTGFDIAMMYEPLVLNYGTPAALTYFPKMIAADPIITVCISTPIQAFIAWRIKIISRTTWIPIVICIFALISSAGGVWTCITVVSVRVFARKPELHWPALTWLLSSAISDVLITLALVWNLYRRKTGFDDTDSAINKIIRLTVQTGMITAIFAIADVVFFMISPRTTLNFIWDLALCKLYSNALVSTLNARVGWDRLINGHTMNNVLFGESMAGVTDTKFQFAHSIRTATHGQVRTTGVELEAVETGGTSLPERTRVDYDLDDPPKSSVLITAHAV
ncbi:hypothetical protein HGRIS_000618 [Hohenbuehelia grisea]|uniref:DUF6534 domain-containing protein n=1 Tax=Hohenbuehelia grisea TaxID=104357 RepID=A0ABR3JS70_9AGAR